MMLLDLKGQLDLAVEIVYRTRKNVFAHRSASALELNNLDRHETIRPWWCMNCGHGSCSGNRAIPQIQQSVGTCTDCLECLHGLDIPTEYTL